MQEDRREVQGAESQDARARMTKEQAQQQAERLSVLDAMNRLFHRAPKLYFVLMDGNPFVCTGFLQVTDPREGIEMRHGLFAPFAMPLCMLPATSIVVPGSLGTYYELTISDVAGKVTMQIEHKDFHVAPAVLRDKREEEQGNSNNPLAN